MEDTSHHKGLIQINLQLQMQKDYHFVLYILDLKYHLYSDNHIQYQAHQHQLLPDSNNQTHKTLANHLLLQQVHIFILLVPQHKIQSLHNSDLQFQGFLLSSLYHFASVHCLFLCLLSQDFQCWYNLHTNQNLL